MALGSWFLNHEMEKQEENEKKGRMFFSIGEPKYCRFIPSDSTFYLADDSSLLYNNGLQGDYSVLLGGNWRFELIVDSQTGLCIHMQSYLNKLEVTAASLDLPDSIVKDLYFVSENPLEKGCGCHYHPFINMAFWDEKKKILCYGDPYSKGEAVEFTPKTIAIIKDAQLKSMYLVLDCIDGEISFS